MIGPAILLNAAAGPISGPQALTGARAKLPRGGFEALMPSAMRILTIATLGTGTLALSACVTPQMHTEAQLNQIAIGCGLALGELMQDESAKKLLLMIHQNPSAEQRVCVARWARKNGLKAVFVNMQFPQEPAT